MPTITERIRRNSFWKILADGSHFLLGLCLMLVARHYGPAEFGVFSLLYAAAISFSILADAGLNLLATRQIAASKNESGECVGALFSCKLAILPLWFIVPAVLFRYTSGVACSFHFVILFALAFSLRNFMEFFGAVFTGFECIQYEAMMKSLANSVILIAAFVSMLQGRPISWIAASMCVGYATGTSVGMILLRSKWRLTLLAWQPRRLSRLYSEALSIVLVGICSAALTKWNVVALGLMHVPVRDIGLFGAAEKLLTAFGLLPAIITSACYPVLSDIHSSERHRFRHAASRLTMIFTAAGALCAIAVFTCGRPAIALIYGEAYLGARGALCILALGMIAMFPTVILLKALIAAGRSWQAAKSTIMACLINVALSLPLIACWGIVGSAVASSAAQGVLFISCLLYLGSSTRPTAMIQSNNI